MLPKALRGHRPTDRGCIHLVASGTETAAALALGAVVAASFRMSLNSNLRKAAAFLHSHRHGNRTKKAGKMAGVCAKAAASCSMWEKSGALSLEGDYNPSFQTVFHDHVWGKGLHIPGPEALHADTLLREHSPTPFLLLKSPTWDWMAPAKRLTAIY